MDFACTRPMQTPAVWGLIKRCRLRGKATAVLASTPHRTSCPLVTSLPLEIKFMILDLLDHRTVGAMLITIPWEIPDSYWRIRLYNGILFEVRKLDPELILDWQLLCLKAEALCEKMRPLRTRQRIMNVLKDIAKPFWAGLSIDDRRELQNLIQERKKQLTKGPTQKPRKRKKRRRW